MAEVFADISMSLDGFVTGPDVRRDQQLGAGGEVLHRWLTDPQGDDTQVLDEMMTAGAGAILMGRRSYDLAEGDGGWQDGGPAGPVPCFVVTHQAPNPSTVRAKNVFTFVTDGVPAAVAQAKATAGDQVVGVHGASVARQCLEAGLLDGLRIHLSPVLLGGGTRLFDHLGAPIHLERESVVATPTTTHLTFRIVR